MLKVYPAIFHEEDGYWVEFPDLNGCVTEGSTIEDAMSMAQEALGLWLASQLEMGNELPTPSKIENIHPEDGVVTYVSTDMNAYRRDTRAVKKMLSIPAWLAKEAEAKNVSLSKVLQDALKEQLHLA